MINSEDQHNNLPYDDFLYENLKNYYNSTLNNNDIIYHKYVLFNSLLFMDSDVIVDNILKYFELETEYRKYINDLYIDNLLNN